MLFCLYYISHCFYRICLYSSCYISPIYICSAFVPCLWYSLRQILRFKHLSILLVFIICSRDSILSAACKKHPKVPVQSVHYLQLTKHGALFVIHIVFCTDGNVWSLCDLVNRHSYQQYSVRISYYVYIILLFYYYIILLYYTITLCYYSFMSLTSRIMLQIIILKSNGLN